MKYWLYTVPSHSVGFSIILGFNSDCIETVIINSGYGGWRVGEKDLLECWSEAFWRDPTRFKKIKKASETDFFADIL